MKMKKRAFTFIEMLISILLFTIIIVFIYGSLNKSKKTNLFIANKVNKEQENSRYKHILFEDILESSKIEIRYDNNGNSILYITTTNTYHTPFFTHIFYKISSNNELLRIESKKSFKSNSMNDLKYIKDYYIDTLITNVEKFKIVKINQENNFYSVVIKQEDSDIKMFSIKTFRN